VEFIKGLAFILFDEWEIFYYGKSQSHVNDA
jgi:hypothetical protein